MKRKMKLRVGGAISIPAVCSRLVRGQEAYRPQVVVTPELRRNIETRACAAMTPRGRSCLQHDCHRRSVMLLREHNLK